MTLKIYTLTVLLISFVGVSTIVGITYSQISKIEKKHSNINLLLSEIRNIENEKQKNLIEKLSKKQMQFIRENFGKNNTINSIKMPSYKVKSIRFDAFPNKEIEFATYPISAPFSSKLIVNNIVPNTISNILVQIDSVCFDIKTPASSYFDVKLKSPSGETIQLFKRRGGIGGSYIRNVCFSPIATKDIAISPPPYNNDLYQPEGGLATWNTLIGSKIAGNWELLVGDAQGVHKDTLTHWSITFKTMIPQDMN
jgi:Proprotein convertase P-domain